MLYNFYSNNCKYQSNNTCIYATLRLFPGTLHVSGLLQENGNQGLQPVTERPIKNTLQTRLKVKSFRDKFTRTKFKYHISKFDLDYKMYIQIYFLITITDFPFIYTNRARVS